jgi:recombinational DNA repair protein (RecF pathway)
VPILKDIAQVLRVHEQGNTSQVVVMLGRRLGQFRIHAKGARRWSKKGFEGGFDLLSRGEILVYPRRGDSLWFYKEWDEHARPRVGNTYAQLRAASFLCELTEALTRHTAGSGAESAELKDSRAAASDQAALYDHLTAAASALNAGAPSGPVLLQFALKALESEGLLPDLTTCAECGKRVASLGQGSWPLWLTAEGVVCLTCREAVDMRQRGVAMSADAWHAIVHVQRSGKAVKLGAAGAEQLARALMVLVHGGLEHDLRTLLSAARAVRQMGPMRKR